MVTVKTRNPPHASSTPRGPPPRNQVHHVKTPTAKDPVGQSAGTLRKGTIGRSRTAERCNIQTHQHRTC